MRLLLMLAAFPLLALGGPMMEVEHIIVQSQGSQGVYSDGQQDALLATVASNALKKINATLTLGTIANRNAKRYLTGTNTPSGMSETQMVSLIEQSRLQPCVGIVVASGTQFEHVAELLAALKVDGVRYVLIHSGAAVTSVDLNAMNKEENAAEQSTGTLR